MNKRVEKKAYVDMWKKKKDLNIRRTTGRIGQDLGNDENNPSFVSNGNTGRFDATLEEVLHLINNAGHSYAYPETFGKNQKSALSKAMDVARGGQFFKIPSIYPANAWFSYYDSTCDHQTCQTIEYLYWSLTSMLRSQENRLIEIGEECKLSTADLLDKLDTEMFKLMTNPTYNFPTKLPEGSYKHSNQLK